MKALLRDPPNPHPNPLPRGERGRRALINTATPRFLNLYRRRGLDPALLVLCGLRGQARAYGFCVALGVPVA